MACAIKILPSHLQVTPKHYIEIYDRIFISALFRDIFFIRNIKSSAVWIFVDMSDTIRLGSRNLRNNE